MDKNIKVVQSQKEARALLKLGHIIVDIKANKNDKSQTVFVFSATEQFQKDYELLHRKEV